MATLKIESLTESEYEAAMAAIERERFKEKQKIAQAAFEQFIFTCDLLGITPRLDNGYYPINNKLEDAEIHFCKEDSFVHQF